MKEIKTNMQRIAREASKQLEAVSKELHAVEKKVEAAQQKYDRASEMEDEADTRLQMRKKALNVWYPDAGKSRGRNDQS